MRVKSAKPVDRGKSVRLVLDGMRAGDFHDLIVGDFEGELQVVSSFFQIDGDGFGVFPPPKVKGTSMSTMVQLGPTR